jgi:4-coumarate--CoA ligase
MRGRLARHKWLEGGVVFVDEVPRLASGKIKRKVMKEWAKRDAEAIDGRAKASLLKPRSRCRDINEIGPNTYILQ